MTLFFIIISSLAFVALLLFVVYLVVLIRPSAKQPSDSSLLCDYAHRGLHGKDVPENSIRAFELACKEGVGIELDVQLSRDGEVIVFHDTTLVRMTGCEKKLCELDLSELKQLSLSGTEQAIPTLREVLATVDGKVPLLVELKGESTDTSICPRVAEILSDYHGPYCIESFNPLLVRNAKKSLPSAFCGLLYTNVCREKGFSALNLALSCMALNVLARPHFIAYNKADASCLPVRITTKLFRAPSFVWTIRPGDDLAGVQDGTHRIFERGDA